MAKKTNSKGTAKPKAKTKAAKPVKPVSKKTVNTPVKIKAAPAPVKKEHPHKGKNIGKMAVSKPVVKQVAQKKIVTHPPVKKAMTGTAPVLEKKHKPASGNNHTQKLRYNDKELAEFKGIILGKLAEARHDLVLLRSSMSHLDDHGTDDTSPTFKLMEDGSDVLTKEETAQLAGRQQKFIKHLEDALVRIENKSYGICRVTGTLIPRERLKVVPHATLSIEAKQKQF